MLMMIVVGTVALPQLPISYFLLATSSFLSQHWLASILPPILITSHHSHHHPHHSHHLTALQSNCVEMETSRKSQMSTSGKFQNDKKNWDFLLMLRLTLILASMIDDVSLNSWKRTHGGEVRRWRELQRGRWLWSSGWRRGQGLWSVAWVWSWSCVCVW